jgi:hypothetical protein
VRLFNKISTGYKDGGTDELSGRTIREMSHICKVASRFIVLFCISFGILDAGAAFAQQRQYTRPGAKTGPTIVSVSIWVIDIDSINSAEQNFVANVFVALRWKDDRLARRGGNVRKYKLADIWDPRVQIANEIGLIRKTMPEEAEVSPDGTVTYRQRYIGPFSQPLNLQDFPFDTHVFQVHLVPAGYLTDQIRFVPDQRFISDGLKYAAGIARDISLPDWEITGFKTEELPYPAVPGYNFAGYVFEFTAQRLVRYYVWKIILPLVLIVLMSWSVFLIDPTNAGTKIGVATTALLTLIAYRFVIESQVPRIPYLTRLDVFILADTLLILSSLFMVTTTAYIVRIEKEDLARKIDRVWRIAFLAVFGIILARTLFL